MAFFIGHAVGILSLFVAVVSGNNEGLAIWANGSESPPEYARWMSDKGFSTSHQMRDIDDGPWQIIRGASSPYRDEAIVMGISDDTVVTAHTYSGGKWNSLPFSPLDDGNAYFDVRYESLSGHPLVVWNKRDTGTLRYAKWTGSDWSLGAISTYKNMGEHAELKLEASPKSNQMVLVVTFRGSTSGNRRSYTYAMVWDGGNWHGFKSLSVSMGDDRDFTANVAFEQQSGRAIVIYALTSLVVCHIWDGAQWSPQTYVYPPAEDVDGMKRTAISADPSTNRIVAVMTPESGNSFWLTVWDGNTWGSKEIVASESPTSSGQHTIAVAFEGTSQRAVATYAAEGKSEVRYRTWSSSAGWSQEQEGPNFGGTPNTMMLSADNESNDVMLAVYGAARDASFCKWSGYEWGEVEQIGYAGGASSSPQPLFFMWKPAGATDAPSAFPTRHPTSPPTRFPTPAPSMKPTRQPTNAPTPQPTRAPTAQPSPSPTTSLTSLPTPLLTQPPTHAPSLMPTNLPTPPPSSTKAAGVVAAGHPCGNNMECHSSTCRNGVCMATSACYPVKHRFGEPFFEHKVNVVFVASGFDTATKEEWHTHVNRTYKSFENYNMFSNKVEQLNMFRVDPRKLDSSYCGLDCSGIARLLCCDQKRALSLAQKCFPVGSNLQTVVIHNDERYGGGGYVNENIATVSTHPMASVVAAHELGHSLFDLADEYSYGSGTDADPNCDSTSSCDKWSDLIGNTPEGYDPVRCLPGCRNGNFYVGTLSFMNVLNRPMGAVNDRFTCCTYCALTKSFPSYCDVFDPSPNYLLNYCKINDYQGYGSASYDKEPMLSISDGSVQDDSTKYVQVEFPVWVSIINKTRSSGALVFKSKQSPLESGMFLRSLVEGDFSSPSMAVKQGFDSLCKVKVFYRTGKETLLYSRNTTIEVPISLDPAGDDEPLVVSEQGGCRNIILDSKGRSIKKIRVKILDLS